MKYSILILFLTAYTHAGDNKCSRVFEHKTVDEVFLRNQMTSEEARILFDFLVFGMPNISEDSRIHFGSLIVGYDYVTESFYVDFTQVQNRTELLFIQTELKIAGFDIKHPIFN